MTEGPSRRLVAITAVLLAVALVTTAWAVDRRITTAQIRDASDELFLLMTLRRGALESYFDTVRAELTFWSLSDELGEHLVDLQNAWSALPGSPRERLVREYIDENPYPPEQRRNLESAEANDVYDEAHRALHPLARAFVAERGYHDFFLIDPDGNVLYTVEKEADFAMNLHEGALRDSGLADVYRRAMASDSEGVVFFSDFARYAPSFDEPALFGGVGVRTAEGRTLGVLAVQVPTERIQEIMHFTAGMGHTGETYLVGDDHRMRSDSRFSETPTTLTTHVESDTARRALAHESGVAFANDYRGVPVLSAYGTFSLDGFDWAVMAEIDRDEVFEAVSDLRLSVPLLGVLLYGLAMASLWFLGAVGLEGLGLDAIDLDAGPPV